MSLISVLVAIVVFGLGMLGIADIYSRAVPASTANQYVTDTTAFGNQFWALLQAQPGIISSIGLTTSKSYTAATLSSAPAALQPWLSNVLKSSATALPNATVKIDTHVGADGNTCTASLCGVTLTITWNPSNTDSKQLRTQTFRYQAGF